MAVSDRDRPEYSARIVHVTALYDSEPDSTALLGDQPIPRAPRWSIIVDYGLFTIEGVVGV